MSKSVKANAAAAIAAAKKPAKKSIASTPTKTEISAAIAAASQGVTVDTCKDFYVHSKGGKYALYGAFQDDTDHKAMYTAAAIIASGAAVMVGDDIQVAKGKARRVTGLLGKSASTYWTGKGYIDNGALTKEGLTEIKSRLAGTHKGGGYKPTFEGIRDIVAAMTASKPSTVKIGPKEYTFKHVLNI